MGFSPEGIAVIIPICAGEEETCRSVLEGINSGESGTVHIDFARQNITHFARLVIIEDRDRGAEHKRIMFSAIFDGRPEDFFADMRDSTSDLDAVWGQCEGYSGKNNFVQFMMKHNNKTGTILRGHRYDTVKDIQNYLALRDELCRKFDVPLAEQKRVLSEMPHNSAATVAMRKTMKRIEILFRNALITIMALPNLIGLLRFGGTLLEARKLLRNPVKLDRQYSDASIDKSPPCREFAEGDEVVPFKENDALPRFLDRDMVQNQMTVITANNPKLLKLSEAVQAYVNAVANLPFVSRNSSVPTIHFGRWMMIDEGKRMLFLSNYDGNWQTYIGDFVDKAATGLNAFWAGSIGWRNATTVDIELFKEGIRCHQTRASYFYAAYPNATVVNVIQARELYEAYHNNIDETTAQEWLKHL